MARRPEPSPCSCGTASGGISRYEVIVQRDLSELAARLTHLFPGENITVASNGTDVVLSGSVSGKYAMDKAAEVAAGYVEKKEDVVNLLKQQEGMARGRCSCACGSQK